MALVMWLIARNLPLSQWERYKDMDCGINPVGVQKQDRIVSTIINSLSHPAAVQIVVRDWHSLESHLRMRVTVEANRAAGGDRHRSNNVTKGILRLDKLLGGRVLKSVDHAPTVRDLRVVGGVYMSRERRLQPAAVGATRAFAAHSLPLNYRSLRPAEKRRIQKELAKSRREMR